jgi:hypothetical protein
MSSKPNDIKRKLAETARRQRDLLDNFSRVLTSGETQPGEQEHIQARLQRLMAEHQRLNDELKIAELESREIPGTPRRRAFGRTVREQTLDTLDEVGVPMAPSAIAEFANATTGIALPTSRFASLRRDEERASRRDPSAKPAWIVPALSITTLTAISRLLTSSAWALERRLVGSRTLRLNHLRALLAYIRRHELLRSTDPARAKLLQNLIWRYARAVPGATKAGENPNFDRIRRAVETELSIIEPDDEAERKHAMAQLERLAPAFQLWGRPALLDGNAAAGRG